MHNIIIINFTEKHIGRTFSWVQDPVLQRDFMIRGEVTVEGHQKYFSSVLNDPEQRIYALLVDGKHVGNCGFKSLSRRDRTAELWIYIGEQSLRGKGIGSQATKLLLNKARTVFALKQLHLHVADFNEPARRMYRRFGFQEVATNPETEWQDRGCSIIRMERLLQELDVALMQPSFLPWLGFFELLWISDVFILLDDFQFSVQSYHQRNRIFVNRKQPDWVTVPVLKTVSFGSPLNRTQINDSISWRNKTWKRIEQNYSRAPFFASFSQHIQTWLLKPVESLAELNIAFIMLVCDLLGIKRQIRKSSEYPSTAKRSQRVNELLRSVEATRYFCARGAFDYMQKDCVFPLPDIEVLFQGFQARPYPQVGSTETFVPSLSILDALLNVGPEGTLDLIMGGTNRWTTWKELVHTAIREEKHEH